MHLGTGKLTGGEVDDGETKGGTRNLAAGCWGFVGWSLSCGIQSAALRHYGYEEILGFFRQQVLFDDGAGGDDSHHVAPDQALDAPSLFHLLSDGDFVATLQQPAYVVRQRAIGYATHGQAHLLGKASRGQDEAQFTGNRLGVVLEQLVEIAQAVEKQCVGMLLLESPVLAQHRRQLCLGHSYPLLGICEPSEAIIREWCEMCKEEGMLMNRLSVYPRYIDWAKVLANWGFVASST